MATATDDNTAHPRFLMYTPEIETIRGQMNKSKRRNSHTMRRHIGRRLAINFGKPMRRVHAKSHGLISR